jgi:hypothetical protein
MCDDSMKKPKIPDGSSIEELAEFWDTHDVTDFLDELVEVTEPIFERRLEGDLSKEEIDEMVIATRTTTPTGKNQSK